MRNIWPKEVQTPGDKSGQARWGPGAPAISWDLALLGVWLCFPPCWPLCFLMVARWSLETPDMLPTSQQLEQKLSLSLPKSFNKSPRTKFHGLRSCHMFIPEPISGAEEMGYSDWSGLDHMPPLEPLCVKSTPLEPQEPRVGNCGFSRSIRTAGHKKSVLVKVSYVRRLRVRG